MVLVNLKAHCAHIHYYQPVDCRAAKALHDKMDLLSPTTFTELIYPSLCIQFFAKLYRTQLNLSESPIAHSTPGSSLSTLSMVSTALPSSRLLIMA